MKTANGFTYLLFSVLIITGGFFLLNAGMIDRQMVHILQTHEGPLDISSFLIICWPNGLVPTLFGLLALLAYAYVRVKVPDADPFILPAIIMLSGIGLILLMRLAPDLAAVRNDQINAVLAQNPQARITNNVSMLAQLGVRHFFHWALGITAMVGTIIVFSNGAFSWLSGKKYIWVICAIILVSMTLFWGVTKNGSTLWLMGIQVTEIVKLLMMFFIAGYFYEKGKVLEIYQNRLGLWLKYAMPFGIMCFFSLVPLLIQKDIGPTFLLFVVFLTVLFCAGNRLSVTLIFIALIAGAGYLSYSYGYPPILRKRFDMLFNPFNTSASMARALWSIASGGLHGIGIGYGQSYLIPEVQSDFNFAVICEEMGFVVAFAVMMIYALLICRCFIIARQTSNLYKKTLCLSIGVLFAVQVLTIVCGNIVLIPLTGITLPFISYGGSSLTVCFVMSGIIIRISGDKS